MKTATEILNEHGINIMRMTDDYNTQILNSMERYAEEKCTEKEKECEELKGEEINLRAILNQLSKNSEEKSKQIEELKAENERLEKELEYFHDKGEINP
jgi:Rps23 Pro-64 3,4-dihydroxylase Tpa1-like proline 4-hydroxylase